MRIKLVDQSPGLTAASPKTARSALTSNNINEILPQPHRQRQRQRQRHFKAGRQGWISLVSQAGDGALAWGHPEADEAESDALSQLKGE